ncbi:MAG: type II toxin-antitoxin system death-on-curing family toxin [Candidatus Woesearchaeota archaeon]
MIKNDNSDSFCFRCHHTWKKRIKPKPSKYCPRCKSPYWNRPRKKISKDVVLKMQKMIINFHNAIIQMSGGERGVRDEGGIYNSTHKLLNHQYKNQRNPTSIGAFTLNEFAKRHYFVDGNKRTAYAVSKIFMLINKCHLQTNYREATEFILEVAKYESKISLEEIKQWLDERCMLIEDKDVETYLNKAFVKLTLGDE